MDVGKINYLKYMKREILVEIWLKLADGDRKEVKNQKRVFEWYPTGGQTCMRVGRTHQRPGVARRPRLTVE